MKVCQTNTVVSSTDRIKRIQMSDSVQPLFPFQVTHRLVLPARLNGVEEKVYDKDICEEL